MLKDGLGWIAAVISLRLGSGDLGRKGLSLAMAELERLIWATKKLHFLEYKWSDMAGKECR